MDAQRVRNEAVDGAFQSSDVVEREESALSVDVKRKENRAGKGQRGRNDVERYSLNAVTATRGETGMQGGWSGVLVEGRSDR